MTAAVTLVLLGACFLAAIPVAFLAVQIAASLLPRRPLPSPETIRPRFAVIMPAHDEEAVIARSISTIMPQLGPAGRLLVVADNCSDATAGVAARAGAEVTIRQDLTRIGKGYALAHGIKALASDPPEVVIVIDADCDAMPGSLALLAGRCLAGNRPAQARYTMLAPACPNAADKVSRLAWTIKTFVRPLGSARLGWPCQLMGSGMALPYAFLDRLDLATGHLAEDQKLGADFAVAGKAPQFCPDAEIVSRLPQGETGKRQQRTRWEHGHLAIIGEFCFPLAARAIAQRSLHLLAFMLDLCVPPLTLLAMALLLIAVLGFAWFVGTGATVPLLASALLLAIFAATIATAWWRFARDVIAWRELAAGPAYCLLKLPSYIRFFIHRRIEWVRTER